MHFHLQGRDRKVELKKEDVDTDGGEWCQLVCVHAHVHVHEFVLLFDGALNVFLLGASLLKGEQIPAAATAIQWLCPTLRGFRAGCVYARVLRHSTRHRIAQERKLALWCMHRTLWRMQCGKMLGGIPK
jgi:hypothetical protein